MLKHGNFFLHCFQNTGINTYKLKLFAKNADLDEEELEVDLNYNVYNHIAVVKQDYNYSLFANGAKIGTVEWTTSYNSNTRIIFGSLTTYDSYYIHEYIDEIRFSDVARYTDSFDVPNNPYGQAVADNRTLTELIEDLEKEKQLKVLPTNIRNQITILGVTGNLIPGIDTSDATATADDIVMSKTAYAQGQKITGTMTQMDIPFSSLPDYGVDTSELTDGENFVQVNNDDTTVGVYAPMSLSVKANTYLPMTASNSDVAAAAGLTADKIVAGNTIFGIIGTGGTTEYESLSNIGTSVNNESLLPESQFVTLSGTVNNTGIVTEDVTHFVAGTSYSSLANTIGLTADKLVEGETVLGIEGTGAGSGGGSEYETLSTVGTLTYQTEVLSGNTLALSGVVSDTGIVTENSTTFVAGSSFSDVATAIGLTSDQIVEGNTVLGIAGTAEVGVDINDYYDLTPPSGTLKIINLIKTIPEIDTSDVTNMNSMFQGCTNLVNVPLLNTANVTSMFSMFQDCSSLTTIPLLDTSKVTSMQSMFSGCTNLVNVPLLNTTKATTMTSMFQGCSSLTTIPLLDTSKVTSMFQMFYNCYNLTSIPILNTSNVTNMQLMFANCYDLVSIPELNTSKCKDMRSMCTRCYALTTVPELDTTNVTDMTNMFDHCTALTNESLDNILAMCAKITNYSTGRQKTLQAIGLTETQATTCTTLSNYQSFLGAGWTTGY